MSNIIIDSGSKEDSDYIDNAIVEFNSQKAPFTQANAFEKINFVVKTQANEVVGGINSVMYCWGILHIDILWVSDSYRLKGIGTKLMEKVEQTAKQKGASLIHLDTFDWQAKEFYLKHGYEVFGILDDCPPRHKRFYMKKVLR